jgi:hypothetical protein
MSENIIREQDDNAVLMRDNGLVISEIISDYEAAHPEEFRKPPRIYDYRDVDLPEVKALIGKMVESSNNLFDILNGQGEEAMLTSTDGARTFPFKVIGACRQFIRAIDSPKIKLTRAELISIALAASRLSRS